MRLHSYYRINMISGAHLMQTDLFIGLKKFAWREGETEGEREIIRFK